MSALFTLGKVLIVVNLLSVPCNKVQEHVQQPKKSINNSCQYMLP